MTVSFERFFRQRDYNSLLSIGQYVKGLNCTIFSDWDHTHQVCKKSTYYDGHLNDKNHENVMNCTYYIVFEQNYKKYQWWIDKKKRIDETRNDFKSNDRTLKAKAEAQTKVSIVYIS